MTKKENSVNEKNKMDQELKFPVLCHYRIIAIDIPNIDFVIETVAKNLGADGPLTRENRSKSGKYLSFGMDINVGSKEELDRINKELNNIEGVKMVL